MARYTDGSLGPFSGKVGKIVGSYWKGRFVMRATPDVSRVVPSPARLLQQQKFAIMAKYLNPLKGIINIGFAHDAELRKVTPRNVAMSVNMANSMNWNGSTWEVSYEAVQLSNGLFLGVDDLTVILQGTDMVVRWRSQYPAVAGLTSTGKEVWTTATDKVDVVFYNIQRGETLLKVDQRDSGGIVQPVPADWINGQNVEVYVVTIPVKIAEFEYDPLSVTEAGLQYVTELYKDGFAVSNTAATNVAL